MRYSLLLPVLLFGLGCNNPQVVAIARQNKPVAVVVSLPATVEDRVRLEALYSDEIRNQLAGRVNVLASNAEVPPGAAKLMVTLSLDSHTAAKAAAATATLGDEAGTAYSLGSGKRFLPAMGDGLLTGVVFRTIAGASSGIREKYHASRLGYRPNHILCEVALKDSIDEPALFMARTDAWEVVKEMRPLSKAAQDEPDGLHKEEARALAKVIVERMGKRGWDPQPTALAQR